MMDGTTMSYIAEVAPIKSKFALPQIERMTTDHLPLLDLKTLPQNVFWQVLGRALTTKRDYGSAAESQFVAWLSQRLGGTMIDAAGNLHIDTRFDSSHRTMFTAHTDTVHSSGGPNKVHVDGKFWRASTGAALGADDGSGCALLAYLIEMGTPGYYVFFRGEECGGIGSKWLSENMASLFDDIDRAIAFDRAGYYDIITHQSGGRCCSDEFAEALAAQLSTSDSWYMPCSGGVYTDTAEFTGIIAECTNVSVGYKNQHGDREEQDVEFLWGLAQLCVAAEWDTLPTKRDPKTREKTSRYSAYADYDDWDKLNQTTGKGVYYGTPLASSYDDYDDDSEELLDVLEMAIETGQRGALIDLIAEAACPEDPDNAKRHLNGRRLNIDLLETSTQMLYDGWSADQVLGDLFDACVNI